uniref:Ig-like domain-containing protein n=1 Tax=Naja naja TaxID=35670 RepID=A0A8C6XQN2_NAJNA
MSLDVLFVSPPRIPLPPKGRETHFLYQEKAECYFYNGTQRVRHLYRSFYDRQEIDYFDSDLGKYVAVTPLAQPDVDKWNRDEQWLQYNKASVDSFCRHNYEVNSYEAPKREDQAHRHHLPHQDGPCFPNTILLCTATGFYPLKIEVQWLKNGQLEEEGVAFGEELQNGDWTYQLQVMLETHLEAPITVQWGGPDPPAQVRLLLLPQSPFLQLCQEQTLDGIMGAVIGVAFLAVGLFSYLKSKKGESGGAGGEIVGRGPYRGGLSSSSAGGQEGLPDE